MAKTINSFKNVLTQYCKDITPQKILEWGPGTSTEIMVDKCSDAKIYTIEHDNKWFKKAETRLKEYNNITLIHKHIKKKSSYASIGFKFAPYDLIFIDGRRRVECCFVALQCVTDNGVILLHDCEREIYRDIIDNFIRVIEERDRTLVFKPKWLNLLDKVDEINDNLMKERGRK